MESIKDLTSNFKKRPFYEEFKKRFPEDVKIIGEIKMASPLRVYWQRIQNLKHGHWFITLQV